MTSKRVFFRFALVGMLALTWTSSARATGSDAPSRPELVVADSKSGCQSAEGAFVAVFDSQRGMLLLSAAPFPGGHAAGEARGSSMSVSVPGRSPWPLDRLGSRDAQVPLWGAHYPFLDRKGNGCVGFDKQRWSAEGDLVTYLRWLVEDVYLELPESERARNPVFRLSDRQVRLRVERPGHGTVRLTGKEGSTLACRYPDSARIYLFMPFVLDAPNARLAVKVSYTDGKYFDTAEKTALGWIVASPAEPGTLTNPPLTIVVEGVGRNATE